MSKVKEFYTKKLEQVEQEGKKILDSKGKNPFIKFPQGVTEFHIAVTEFRMINTFNKDRALFDIVVKEKDEPVKYTWSVTMTSPLFRKVLKKLASAKEGQKFVHAVINRFGTGTNTRYELIE